MLASKALNFSGDDDDDDDGDDDDGEETGNSAQQKGQLSGRKKMINARNGPSSRKSTKESRTIRELIGIQTKICAQ